MAVTQEVEQFITDSGLTGDVAAKFRAAFEEAPKAQEVLKGNALRQSDYSKHLNDIQVKEAAVVAAQTKLDAEFARLSAYGTDADAKVLKAQQAVEAAQGKLVRAQNRAQRWMENNGVPEAEVKEVFGDTQGTPEVKPVVVATGDDATLTVGEFKRQAKEFANNLAYLPAVQQKIAVQHYNLFGKFPEDMEIVVKAALESGRNLAEVAAEHYKFAEKRAELNDAKIEEKYKTKYEKELQAKLSEAHVPTSTRPQVPGARVFSTKPAEAPKPVVPNQPAPQHERPVQRRINTVQRAVEAFRSGKYSPGAQPTT